MKIIEEFIDSLFSGVVETSETKQLKADLLANAEDRYEDLLSQGNWKMKQLVQLFLNLVLLMN